VRSHAFLLLACVFLGCAGGGSGDERSEVNDARWLVDSSRSLDVGQVSVLPAERWEARPPPDPSATVLWARVKLPASDHERWLTIGNAYLDRVTLFDAAGTPLGNAGVRSPWHEQPLRLRTPAFPLPRDEVELLVRIEADSVIDPTMHVASPRAVVTREERTTLVRGLIYGLLLIMAVYALLLGSFVKSRATVYYGLYASLTAVWLAMMGGDLQLLTGATVSKGWMLGVHWTLLFGQLFAVSFCRELLETKQHLRGADRLLQVLRVIIAADIVAGLFLPWRVLASFVMVLGPALYIAYAYTGVRRVLQGSHPARYYAAGWGVMAVLMVASGLAVAGVLPAFLSVHGPQLAFAVDAVFLALALSDRAREDHERIGRLHQAGSRFVPFEFLAALGRRELSEVARGDQIERRMTVFFSDVRSFTTLVEGMSPQETIGFVNAYLGVMEPPITRAGGFIDKYIGDAVMALFESADDAVGGAIAALRALDAANADRRASGKSPITIGIGLHTGTLMLGTVGGERRLSCTVLGDSVNLASRVESLTKKYGAALLITDATRAALSPERLAALELREVDRVAVKGKSEPVTLYEVLDGLDDASRARRRSTRLALEESLATLRRGEPQQALERLNAAAEIDPADPTLALHRQRCRDFAVTGLPVGWDGVVRLDSK
jgi:class 3 adenylate cyclase